MWHPWKYLHFKSCKDVFRSLMIFKYIQSREKAYITISLGMGSNMKLAVPLYEETLSPLRHQKSPTLLQMFADTSNCSLFPINCLPQFPSQSQDSTTSKTTSKSRFSRKDAFSKMRLLKAVAEILPRGSKGLKA